MKNKKCKRIAKVIVPAVVVSASLATAGFLGFKAGKLFTLLGLRCEIEQMNAVDPTFKDHFVETVNKTFGK